MKETTLHLMVGLPCSGKTTLARHLKEECGALLLSPDEWQVALFGDDFGEPDHDRRHDTIEAMLFKIADQALRLGTSIILDYGFWSRAERDHLRDVAKELNCSFQIHFLDTPMDEIRRRLQIRNQKNGQFDIPFEAIEQWSKQFEPPTETDEMTLGYTIVYQ